jgi:hypothetical protein
MYLMMRNLPVRKWVFQLLLLFFLFCGNILSAQINQFSIPGIDADHSIYKLGTEWTFAYQFIPPPNKMNDYGITTEDLNKVENVIITVVKTPEYMKKRFHLDSSQNLSFEYEYPPQSRTSQSTIVEGDEAVWIHPPRHFFFKILQLNPYPYIKKPLKKGLKWAWELRIGDYWGDKRWKEWTGVITNISTYEITGDALLATKFGKVKCYIVQASAKSELGVTYLTGYFNPTFGFVKLDYTNIDGSKIILELTGWKPKNSFPV